MGDDLASLEQTGKQIPELTYDRVRASYGPEVADNWQQEREFSSRIFMTRPAISTGCRTMSLIAA